MIFLILEMAGGYPPPEARNGGANGNPVARNRIASPTRNGNHAAAANGNGRQNIFRTGWE